MAVPKYLRLVESVVQRRELVVGGGSIREKAKYERPTSCLLMHKQRKKANKQHVS